MVSRAKTRREIYKLSAVDPDSGGQKAVFVSEDKIKWLGKLGHQYIYEAKYNVPHVLQNPTAIFQGLKRDSDEPNRGTQGWHCYCGCPPHTYAKDGQQYPARSQYVFLAFVTVDDIVYTWRWEKSDPQDPHLPVNHNERFEDNVI